MVFHTLTLSNPYSSRVQGASSLMRWHRLTVMCLAGNGTHVSSSMVLVCSFHSWITNSPDLKGLSGPTEVTLSGFTLCVHRDFTRGRSRSQCLWHGNLETASSLMPGVWLNELFNTVRDIIQSLKRCSESIFIDMENCSWYTNNKIIIIAIVFIIICINKVHRNQCGRIFY